MQRPYSAPSRRSHPLPPRLRLSGPFERRAFSADEVRAPARRAPGHCWGGRGAAGRRVRREEFPVPGLPGTPEKTPRDRGRFPTLGPRSLHRRAEHDALSRSSGLFEGWGVGGFPNSGSRGVCGCSGRLQHSRATAPQTSPCREARPRALGLHTRLRDRVIGPGGAHLSSSRPF